MKILVDVDRGREYRSVFAILSRLNLPEADLTLLHSEPHVLVQDTVPYLSEFSSPPLPGFFNHEGMGLLLEASSEAGSFGLSGETLLEEGDAPEELIRVASQMDIDLIATATLGCTAHKLITKSPTSFIVTQGAVPPTGPIRCLFATDHSTYSNLAFQKLLEWVPQGIQEVVVFTAMAPTDRLLAASFHRHGFQDESHAARAATRQCEELAKRLEERGFRAQTRIWTGHVPHAIDVAVKESNADLLVIGAQGHGFIDKLYAGSTASAVLAHATYPVLVMRP